MHSGSRLLSTRIATWVGALFLIATAYGCAGVKTGDTGGGATGGTRGGVGVVGGIGPLVPTPIVTSFDGAPMPHVFRARTRT